MSFFLRVSTPQPDLGSILSWGACLSVQLLSSQSMSGEPRAGAQRGAAVQRKGHSG